MNRQRDDACNIQLNTDNNSTKLKYLTTNFVDLEEAETTSNFFSIGLKGSLYTPADKITQETELQHSEVTNQRAKTGFGALPLPTMPGKYFQNAYGDPEVEENIRGVYLTRDRVLEQYNGMAYNRTFPTFPEGSVYDNMLNFVEDTPRGGEYSRKFKKSGV
jgi:hypothetical protein